MSAVIRATLDCANVESREDRQHKDALATHANKQVLHSHDVTAEVWVK